MRVAIVYDRVNKWGGAERVLLALHEIFPKAPLYTSVYNKKTARWAEVFPEVRTSFLQKIPIFRTRHEFIAPLMPMAFESFDFSQYDLVISVTSEAAKGIITKPGTKHICYLLTPTRYLWSGYNDYFPKKVGKLISKPIVTYLRYWDRVAAQRPDEFVAISTEVQDRIEKYYNRDSEIVYPPVDISRFKNVSRQNSLSVRRQKHATENEKYFLIVSRLVPYKKVDLAVKTFSKLEDKLIVVGIGSEEKYLKSIATGNVEFRGFISEVELIELYKNALAFIFPQSEDFGITAVEAQVAGVPVIAYRSGGALDTVVENETGIFFDEQTVDSLKEAVLRFKKKNFKKDSIMSNGGKFSKDKFKKAFIGLVK